MSAIKDGRFPIEMNGTTYHMLFSLNVMDELEDKCGAIDDLAEYLDGKGRMKKIKWLFTLLINEGMDEGAEPLTESQVGKMIHSGNMNDITSAMFKAFRYSHTGTTDPPVSEGDTDNKSPDNDSEDAEDNEGKNAESGKVIDMTLPGSYT